MMVGPTKDTVKYFVDSKVHLVQELDGTRILGNMTSEFLQKVPSKIWLWNWYLFLFGLLYWTLVYQKWSNVTTLVRGLSVCPSVGLSLNISETAHSFFPKLCIKLEVNKVKKVTWTEFSLKILILGLSAINWVFPHLRPPKIFFSKIRLCHFCTLMVH